METNYSPIMVLSKKIHTFLRSLKTGARILTSGCSKNVYKYMVDNKIEDEVLKDDKLRVLVLGLILEDIVFFFKQYDFQKSPPHDDDFSVNFDWVKYATQKALQIVLYKDYLSDTLKDRWVSH